jgi:hypothetical protein
MSGDPAKDSDGVDPEAGQRSQTAEGLTSEGIDGNGRRKNEAAALAAHTVWYRTVPCRTVPYLFVQSVCCLLTQPIKSNTPVAALQALQWELQFFSVQIVCSWWTEP